LVMGWMCSSPAMEWMTELVFGLFMIATKPAAITAIRCWPVPIEARPR
jgi:hypothetical protein